MEIWGSPWEVTVCSGFVIATWEGKSCSWWKNWWTRYRDALQLVYGKASCFHETLRSSKRNLLKNRVFLAAGSQSTCRGGTGEGEFRGRGHLIFTSATPGERWHQSSVCAWCNVGCDGESHVHILLDIAPVLLLDHYKHECLAFIPKGSPSLSLLSHFLFYFLL